MVNSGSSANLVGVAALFYKKDRPLQRGDEVHRARDFLGHDLSSAAAIWAQAQVRRRRTGHAQHGRAPARSGHRPRDAHDRGVSILGNPAALDVMRSFADGTASISSRTIASRWTPSSNGRKAGTFGDVNTFSFFFSHHISTMEGGMVLDRRPGARSPVQSHPRPWLDARPAAGLAVVRAARRAITSRPTASSCRATMCGRWR